VEREGKGVSERKKACTKGRKGREQRKGRSMEERDGKGASKLRKEGKGAS
jgi:hypothetical protein